MTTTSPSEPLRAPYAVSLAGLPCPLSATLALTWTPADPDVYRVQLEDADGALWVDPGFGPPADEGRWTPAAERLRARPPGVGAFVRADGPAAPGAAAAWVAALDAALDRLDAPGQPAPAVSDPLDPDVRALLDQRTVWVRDPHAAGDPPAGEVPAWPAARDPDTVRAWLDAWPAEAPAEPARARAVWEALSEAGCQGWAQVEPDWRWVVVRAGARAAALEALEAHGFEVSAVGFEEGS